VILKLTAFYPRERTGSLTAAFFVFTARKRIKSNIPTAFPVAPVLPAVVFYTVSTCGFFFSSKPALIKVLRCNFSQADLMFLSLLYRSFYLLVLILASHTYAQYKETDFIRYSIKDGLSDNYITSLQQDEWGYVWIGTDDGLNRFDGSSFKSFYQGSSLNLASNTVIRLKMLDKNKLGILGTGGFQVLDTRTQVLKNYLVPDKTAFTVYRNNVWDAVQKNASYYITTTAGFYEFDHDGNLVFQHEGFKPSDVNNKTIRYGRDIFPVAPDMQVIYTGETGMAIFDPSKRIYREIDKADEGWTPFRNPVIETGYRYVCKAQLNAHEYLFFYGNGDSVLYYDHRTGRKVLSLLPGRTSSTLGWESKVTPVNDSVYAINGQVNGFYVFVLDKKTGRVNLQPQKLLPKHKINCLFVDKDKRLWAGTSLGLLQQKLNTPFLQTRLYAGENEDSVSGWFSSTLRYKDKTYLGRFSRAYGLLITCNDLNGPGKKITFFTNGSAWNEVRSMQRYHADTIWLGTNAGLLWFDTKSERYGKLAELKKLPELKGFFAMLAPPHPDGSAWMVSFMKGSLARYDITSRTFRFFTKNSQPALPFNRVKAVVYDAYGDVWVSGHGLTRWNNRLQVFDTTIYVYSGVNKFYEDILAISADKEGSLWLHNARNALLEYQINNKQFISYTFNDGLPSSEIRALSPVIENKLWIGCNNQLAVFDTRTKKTMLFNESDGLPESRPSGRVIDYDSSSNMYFLSCNNHILFFPKTLPASRVKARELLIEEMVVNDRKRFFNPANKLKLQPGENNLALYFSIIDFEHGNDYKFSYRLNDGTDWINIANQRMINLTGLSPGKYLIALRATAKSGDQYLKQLEFSIAPPFWKRTWFFISMGILLTTLAFALYRYRVKTVRQKANLDKLLAQTEMKALHAQMNPHFIFNSINSISEMILNNENKDASHYLSKFAHLIRVTLDQSGKAFVSLRNTMDYLQRYIEMEQIRNNHFTFTMSAEPVLDLDEIQLPPMLIQPFIENAIWHGITDGRKDIAINVTFKKEGEQLVCIIEDNGIGIKRSLAENKTATHRPVGISNIRNRIQLLNEKHQMQCSLAINDKSEISAASGTGTVVTLRLPLELKET
jgi:ligand-binding sensor domain-containing protein/two-component sensor histidine kinase